VPPAHANNAQAPRELRPDPQGLGSVDRRNGLNWNDPAECAEWLDDIVRQVNDLLGAADDQALPLADRRLGPVMARELLADARKALTSQLAYARNGLGPNGGKKR
jgi:hypothetical protein